MSSATREPCDRCPGEPKVQWLMPDGHPGLLMCWHHAREHGPALTAARWTARTLIDPASGSRPSGQPATT